MNWERVGEAAKWTAAACIVGLAIFGGISYVQNH